MEPAGIDKHLPRRTLASASFEIKNNPVLFPIRFWVPPAVGQINNRPGNAFAKMWGGGSSLTRWNFYDEPAAPAGGDRIFRGMARASAGAGLAKGSKEMLAAWLAVSISA